MHAQLRKACASEECLVCCIPCVQAKRMSSRPHPETPKTWKPQKPANLKTKCPVCGMPGVQVKRMPSRPHPETPKPETQNPQTLKASVLSVACHVFKQNECHHNPTPKPRNHQNPKPKTPQTLKASVLSVACHVFKQNECHHDPTPKPRKLRNPQNPKPKTPNPQYNAYKHS